MAASEWTHSVRAIWYNPVEDYSAPGVNTWCRFAYHPVIDSSPVLLALSVSYLTGTLWHCGQHWPYVGLGSWGMPLHQDGNAMRDAAKISPRIPFTCAPNAILSLPIIDIIPSRQIYVAINNPSLVPSASGDTTGNHLWNSVCTANDVSHGENWKSNGCRCFSHLYKFRDEIQVTQVSSDCAERQN